MLAPRGGIQAFLFNTITFCPSHFDSFLTDFAVSSTELFDIGAGTLPTTFFLCQLAPHRVLPVGTLEQQQKTGGREKDCPFHSLAVLVGIAPALAFHRGQQPLLLVSSFFATLRSSLGRNASTSQLASLPQGLGPAN